MNETIAKAAAARLALSDEELLDLTARQLRPEMRRHAVQYRAAWLEERRAILGAMMAGYFESPQEEDHQAQDEEQAMTCAA